MAELSFQRESQCAPTLAIVASTLLWGTLWIPLRKMRETGPIGASATTVGFLLPLALLLPIALGRGRRGLSGLRELAGGSFWLALGIALYAEALVRGRVAQVILLFYLTPVWSTLLARIALGVPITGARVVTIALGLAGMFVIFGAGSGIPVPRAAAEWMGLAAGFVWGLAMVGMNRSAERPLFDRIFAQFVFLGPVFFAVTRIPGGAGEAGLDLTPLAGSLPWLLAFAGIWMLPVVWLTIFGASHLDPGRVAIFLMLEIVVGLTTAGLFTDEPFGPRELIGAALILGATGAELGAEPTAQRRRAMKRP